MRTNFGGVCGAILGCHCSVLDGDDKLLGGCVLSLECAMVGTIFFLLAQKLLFRICGLCRCNLMSVVPLLAAIVMSYEVPPRRIRWFCEI